MPDVDDRVRIVPTKVGQPVREGVVTGISGHLLTVRWVTGEESTFAPGPGAVRVVGKVRKSTGKKASAPAKAAKKTTKAPKR